MDKIKLECKAATLINPVAKPESKELPLAPRLDSLKGKVIGILDNAKPKADVMMRVVKEYFETKGAVCDTIYEFKPQLSKPLPMEQIERLAKADAVIGAVGDCGSCSTGLAKDAVALEKLGVPTATIFTRVFAVSAAYNAAGQCMPDLPIAIIPTPTGYAGDIPDEEIVAYTKQIVQNMEEILITTDLDKLIKKYSAQNFVAGKKEIQKEIVIGKAAELKLDAKGDKVEYEKLPDPEEMMDYLEKYKAGDGLPVVPPTPDRVRRMLEYSLYGEDDELLKLPPKMGVLTPRLLAANAVMAGCKPEYYPILETAFVAMKSTDFNLGGMMVTTGEIWPSIIVSGPYAQKIGMNSGFGEFGPGNRANMTIGRAITLTIFAVGGAFPGDGTFATFGNMTRRGLAFADDPNTPWDMYHTEMGYPDETTVTVASTINPSLSVEESEEAYNILYVVSKHIAATGTRGDYNPGEFIVVFNPIHRARLAKDGWTKADIKQYLYENARGEYRILSLCGTQVNRKRWPKWVYGNPYDGKVPFLRGPEDVIILAGGGEVAAHTAVFPTWHGNSKTQTVPLKLPAGFR